MKAVYNIRNMRRKPHPLQDKIERGEVKLIDHLNIPETDFQSLIATLEPHEREVATRNRDNCLTNIR